jgi:lysozyme
MKHPRLLAAALTLSAAGLVALTQDEGYTDQAVRPLPTDRPTYGFGSTWRPDGSPVQIGDTIRPPQALALTLREVRKGETALHRCVNAPLTQGEFDSLVSLAYNVGADAVCRSTMVRLHNAGQHAQACAEFDRWVYFQGKDCRDPAHRCGGLPKRRAAERAMCEGRP